MSSIFLRDRQFHMVWLLLARTAALRIQRIRNYTARPINVEIRRPYEGHVTFVSRLEPKLHDYQTVELATQVEPGEKKNLDFTIVQHRGRNAKQNNVTLEAGTPN